MKKTPTPKLSKEELEAIERGLKDIEEGRTIPHKKVMEILRKKYPFLSK